MDSPNLLTGPEVSVISLRHARRGRILNAFDQACRPRNSGVYCAGDDQRTERCHLLKDAAWLKVAKCWGRGGPMKIAIEICVPVFASGSTSMKRRPRWGKRGTFEAAGSDCSARSRGTAPRPRRRLRSEAGI